MLALTPGQRAARLRKVLGFTQQEVAKAAGISRVYLNNIEHDLAPNVRPLILDAIARRLGFASWGLLAASRTLEEAGLGAGTGDAEAGADGGGEIGRLRREIRVLERALSLVHDNVKSYAAAA